MITKLAEIVDLAAQSAKDILPLTDDHPINLEQAYDIQKASIDRRFVRGETLTGYKLGFTSREKMIQMGVDSIIWGRLTDAMSIENMGDMRFDEFIHPKVEPEIVFLMKRPLSGIVTTEEALDAVEAVAPALEIIDSRFRDFKFTHFDVVADNCSSAGYVIGDWRKPDIDLADLSMTLVIDGCEVAKGSSKAILDHPLNALVEAVKCISESGELIQAGQVILAGAATAAVSLEKGQSVSVNVEQLGSCGFKIV
jgi:2-oxo-3-hexenedioate decarboxylase